MHKIYSPTLILSNACFNQYFIMLKLSKACCQKMAVMPSELKQSRKSRRCARSKLPLMEVDIRDVGASEKNVQFSRVRVWCLFLLSRLSARIVIGRGVCDPGCFQIRFRPGHRIVNGIRPRRHWNPFTGTLDPSKNRRSLLRSAGLTEVIFKTNFTSDAVLDGYM